LEDACKHAADLGFDAIEVFPSSAAALDRNQLRELLEKYHLRVAAFGTGGGWVVNRWHLCHADAHIRSAARAFLHEIIDLAADFSAPTIIGSMQGRAEGSITKTDAFSWLREALIDCDAHAGELHSSLLFEPLNRFETNLCNQVREVCAMIGELHLQNTRVLADLFHMNIEEVSIPDALRTAGPKLGHVHFADSNRHAMGFGHTQVASIAQTLREIGWSGYLSAEILPLPDSVTAARQTIASIRKWFGGPPSCSNA
jgi:sugar phosphate isomerase/epimerase